jgi:hypothetical protein
VPAYGRSVEDGPVTFNTRRYAVPRWAGRQRFIEGATTICREHAVQCTHQLERELLILGTVRFTITGPAEDARKAAREIAQWALAFKSHAHGGTGG